MTVDRLLEAARERLREFDIELIVDSPPPSRLVPHADSGIDAIATLSRRDTKARYSVEVKEQMSVSSVANGPPRASQYPLLVIGEHVTRRSAVGLRKAGIQFIDAQGNAFISFGDVFVEVQGRNAPTTHGLGDSQRIGRADQPANLFSARRSQVIFALLAWPELVTANIRDIADAAGASVGQAHDALAQLQRAAFLVPAPRRLARTGDLLDYWTAAYPTGLSRRLDLARYHGDPSKPVKRLRAEQPTYLSGESATETEVARPATLTVYVDALDPKLPIVNRWSSSPEHPPNVFVRYKFWASPGSKDETSADESVNAPWPLVYADLVATGDARLAEVARAWRTRFARSGDV